MILIVPSANVIKAKDLHLTPGLGLPQIHGNVIYREVSEKALIETITKTQRSYRDIRDIRAEYLMFDAQILVSLGFTTIEVIDVCIGDTSIKYVMVGKIEEIING